MDRVVSLCHHISSPYRLKDGTHFVSRFRSGFEAFVGRKFSLCFFFRAQALVNLCQSVVGGRHLRRRCNRLFEKTDAFTKFSFDLEDRSQ